MTGGIPITLNAQGHFAIDAGWKAVPAISAWPGWKRTPSGVYVGSPWASTVMFMDITTPGLNLYWTLTAAALRDRLMMQVEGMKNALAYKGPINLMQTTRRPRLHQAQAAYAMGWIDNRALLSDDMGLGKTATALWTVGAAKRVLIVCPVGVKFNWQREITKTLGEEWAVQIIAGTAKQRATLLAEVPAMAEQNQHSAVVINYDLLRYLSDLQLGTLREFADEQATICDESHYLKNESAQRTQLVRYLSQGSGTMLLLSGTPIRDTSADLYSQIELLHPGTWRSRTDFDMRYIVKRIIELPGRHPGSKRKQTIIVGTKNTDELNAIVNTIQIRRLKTDVTDMPPKVYTKPDLELDSTTRKLYDAMKDFARVEMAALIEEQGEDLSVFHPRARSSIEASMRCEQIAQGFLGGIPDFLIEKIGPYLKHAEKIPGRPRELVFPNSTKLRWLIETIETLQKQGSPTLVGSRFNAPMFWLEEHLQIKGINTMFMHGGLTEKQKDKAVTDFQEARIDVLLCQVSIAEGWNATRAQDVIHYGRDWSPAINYQFEDRAHRMGQKGTVNVQIPVVRKSVEVLVDKKLSSKAVDAAQSLRNTTLQELMESL